MWSDTFDPDHRAEALSLAFDEFHSLEMEREAGERDGIEKSKALLRTPSKFECWLQDYPSTVDEEILLVENVTDSHKGKRLLNIGTPLYNAVVRDLPMAVSMLLAKGSNPNYRHPTGDTPLLHCAERGYVDSLQALLEASERIEPEVHVTASRRFFLGQGMPLYEEGGLNPVSVAARKGRFEIVQCLVFSHVRWIEDWILARDVIGRDCLEQVLDSVALSSKGNQHREDLIKVARLLMKKLGREHDGDLELLVPTPEQARQRDLDRMREVRLRCAEEEKRRKAQLVARGLKAVASHYKPIHPEVYMANDVRIACQRPDLSVSNINSGVTEPIPGVFSFPLVDPQFCCSIWEEMHNYEKMATTHPKLGLPLHVRHDGNMGELQDCGFQRLLDALADLCSPVLQRCILLEREADQSGTWEGVEIYHAFLTRNYLGRDSNATFKMHRDKSEVTINICLHASDGFEGSTVGFYDRRTPPGASDDPTDDPPNDEDRIYTHTHNIGRAVVHNGSAWHRTDPIVKGTRGSLIIWARSK